MTSPTTPLGRRPAAGSRATEPLPHPSRFACRICGGPLSVHDEVRGRVCPARRCQRTATLRRVAEERRQRLVAAQDAAEGFGASVEKRLRPRPDGVVLAVLPANHDSTAPLGKRRRRSLRLLLDELVAEVRQAGEPEGAPPPASDASKQPSAAELTLLRLGCATCRGHCCAAGADHAFLDADTIGRYWRAHPGTSGEQVVAAYLERLPERSVRRSCLFHGKDGCVLPRDMRSNICNDFYCKGLLDLRAQLSDPARQSVLAINMNLTTPTRGALFSERGIQKRFRGKATRTAE